MRRTPSQVAARPQFTCFTSLPNLCDMCAEPLLKWPLDRNTPAAIQEVTKGIHAAVIQSRSKSQVNPKFTCLFFYEYKSTNSDANSPARKICASASTALLSSTVFFFLALTTKNSPIEVCVSALRQRIDSTSELDDVFYYYYF